MRIELRCFVQSGRNAIVIAPNRSCVQAAYSVDHLHRIRPVTHDIATTKDFVVTGRLGTFDGGVECFQVGVDVTEDEIAHGV